MTSLAIPTDFPALHNKVVLLTGGSNGIGLAAAQLFTAQGARLIIADLQPPSVSLPNTTFLPCDVTSWSTLLRVFYTATALHGGIDILLANAGIGEIEDMFLDTIDPGTGELTEPKYKVLDVNLKGAMNCVKLAVKHWRDAGRSGRIVMTASTAGYMGEVGLPVYSAAKHALVGFMRATYPTAAKFGISISCVAPWMTETALIFPALRAALTTANIPIQKPESVARAMAYAATASQTDLTIETGDAGKVDKPWTGRTIYVAGDTFTELEDTLQALQPQWLGKENSTGFQRAQAANYFASASGM